MNGLSPPTVSHSSCILGMPAARTDARRAHRNETFECRGPIVVATPLMTLNGLQPTSIAPHLSRDCARTTPQALRRRLLRHRDVLFAPPRCQHQTAAPGPLPACLSHTTAAARCGADYPGFIVASRSICKRLSAACPLWALWLCNSKHPATERLHNAAAMLLRALFASRIAKSVR